MQTVTLNQIILSIRVHKTCSESQALRYLKRMGIKPVGVRQRPQRYPADTAERILSELGFVAEDAAPATRIPSMAELRAVRAKSQGGRAGVRRFSTSQRPKL